jgi:hypothetical protein
MKYLLKQNIIQIIYHAVYANEVKDDLDSPQKALMSFHIVTINLDAFL